MPGNVFGQLFTVTTFGESHGPAMGCIIDGCPAGLELSADDIEKELIRRRPGSSYGSRDEKDTPEILSGVFEGKTLGTPIAVLVHNTNQNSRDYDELKNIYRPGHADWTWEAKYGFRDHRGGGRSSGRETLCRVAAGAVAKKFLAAHGGIAIRAWTSSIAGINMPFPKQFHNYRAASGASGSSTLEEEPFDFDETERNILRVPCKFGAQKALAKLEELRAAGDSAGGTISCLITGVSAGLGEPVFDKLDARLAAAMLSIGACKGIEFGTGFAAAGLTGSENNSALTAKLPVPNSGGGISGGISDGQDIYFTTVFKPTPSIGKPQKALDREGGTREITIKGRHDVCIVPRAVPVVEAMAALVLADFLLLSRADKI